MLELGIFAFGCLATALVAAFVGITVRQLRRIGHLRDVEDPGTKPVEWKPSRHDRTRKVPRAPSDDPPA